MSKIIMISSSATNVILRYTDDTSHNLRKKIKEFLKVQKQLILQLK